MDNKVKTSWGSRPEAARGAFGAAPYRIYSHLKLPQAVHIAKMVMRGVQHIHRHSIIHRDIKPSNVLVDGDDVVVADFGDAKDSGLNQSLVACAHTACHPKCLGGPIQQDMVISQPYFVLAQHRI